MKKTKLRSRRRTALQRILIAAAAYLAVTCVFGTGLLLPAQTVRQNEERYGVGKTSIIVRDWEPEIRLTQMLYLTENENVTFFSGAYWTVVGWMSNFTSAVDCSGNEPLYASQLYLFNSSRNFKEAYYYYGRIDDPEIQCVEIRVEYIEKGENGEFTMRKGQRIVITESHWIEKDGRRYFYVKAPEAEWPVESGRYTVVAGCDAEGKELVQLDIQNNSYRYFE